MFGGPILGTAQSRNRQRAKSRYLSWVRLPWRDVWESLIGTVSRVLVLQG